MATRGKPIHVGGKATYGQIIHEGGAATRRMATHERHVMIHDHPSTTQEEGKRSFQPPLALSFALDQVASTREVQQMQAMRIMEAGDH